VTSRAQLSRWAVRASVLYDSAYARRYREHDEEFERSEPCRRFAEWLQQVCAAFSEPIDVLDLGCGTGRYFWALRRVRELTGVDASAAMLVRARSPYRADRIRARSVKLIEGDLFGQDFGAGRFDLVYSIGVLAEHVPLDATIVSLVSRWLRPNGRFAFTTVHPESPSIPLTVKRRVGKALERVSPGPIQRRLHRRLIAGGLYADERRLEQLFRSTFEIETLRRFESEAHLHCWCVARKSDRS
jgi:SAM-dependent methyltransferase